MSAVGYWSRRALGLLALVAFQYPGAWAAGDGRDGVSAVPSPARRQELIRLVRHDCGACHGMTLQGGLGPALLPSTLAGKPAENLVATIIGGRAGTPMPPWRPFLTMGEAEWIVANLIAGFPQ